LITFDASRLTVLQITAPQPTSNALPMTLALVPGGPEAITNGLGSVRPLTVVSSVGIALPPWQRHKDMAAHARPPGRFDPNRRHSIICLKHSTRELQPERRHTRLKIELLSATGGERHDPGG
jgi:hypothetical protein